MHPETAAPSLLFISSFVSLVLIVLQVSPLRKSQWDLHDAQGTRRLLALSVMLSIALLSALSGSLGLVAYQARCTGNRPRAARVAMGGKIIVVILQSGLSLYMMYLLNVKALIEPIPSPRINILTFGKVRVFTAVMSSPLVANTVLSIVFAALQEDYPAARLPALCWLLFFIPLSCVSFLLYVSIRRAEEHSIIARMWLVLAVGHACGVLSATCALVGKGDFQAPTSLFDAFWITCFIPSCPIPTQIPSFRDVLLSGAGCPPALLRIPLVPATPGQCDPGNLVPSLQRKISELFKIRLRHLRRRLQRSRSLCLRPRVLNRRGRKASRYCWPRLVTRHLQTSDCPESSCNRSRMTRLRSRRRLMLLCECQDMRAIVVPLKREFCVDYTCCRW
ncbi:hypothetical protein BC827DRAFT_712775 [Russula dissimulans]|nr:hypothetical protein BC827DRAFT_712775 [Russula dissimulans]